MAMMISWVARVNPYHPYLENDPAPSFDPTICAFHLGFGLVISRKISGGTRSEAGSDSKMILASLFGTWRVRGLDPLVECHKLLTSPQV